MNQMQYPLAGIKVLEIATAVAAPTAARIMSSFGADVIKIETPPQGDILRAMASAQIQCGIQEENPLFDLYNSGKMLMTLDLKSTQGQNILNKLLGKTDVFITNIRMQSLERLGLGYDTLKERFPRLIYAHLSGFGLNGPDVNRPGFDLTAFWMRSGGAIDSVEPGTYPLMPSFAFGDITSASAFLSGILMALIARAKSGKGTLVSTSLFGAGIWSNASFIVEAQGKRARSFPSSHYSSWDPFSCLYQCSDGEWIALMEKRYITDRFTFARVLNMPELIEDPELATLEMMSAVGKSEAVIRKVERIMRTKTSQEWKQIMDDNDIANEIARHFVDIPQDPQAKANGYFDEMPYFEDDFYAIPIPPIQFSEYARIKTKKVASLSGDTENILSSLGYSEPEILALRKQKVIL